MKNLDYTLCAVVLDKKSHLERYQKSAFHPYHYCTNVLLERYVFYLQENGGRGDVLAEARGKREDHALKEEYKTVTISWSKLPRNKRTFGYTKKYCKYLVW